MLTCPNCKKPVEADAIFCNHCGSPLKGDHGSTFALAPASTNNLQASIRPFSNSAHAGGALQGTCSACGFVNLPGEMFCQNCGVQLPPVASMPPPAPERVTDPNAESTPKPGDRPVSFDGSGDYVKIDAQKTDEPAGKLELKVSGEETLLPLNHGEVIIGRIDPTSAIYPDLDLSSIDGERRGVSRRHARIVRQDDIFYIEDLNSTNFTFLNRKKLEPGQSYPLADGDEIRLGLLVFIFHSSNGR